MSRSSADDSAGRPLPRSIINSLGDGAKKANAEGGNCRGIGSALGVFAGRGEDTGGADGAIAEVAVCPHQRTKLRFPKTLFLVS
jgi:hypothetical protein